MGVVSVSVNGRRYDITCDDGQERHVEALASEIDARVRSLAASVGALGDSRLLLLAALLIADDLQQARSELEAARHAAPPQLPMFADNQLAETLDRLAQRIETVAARLRDA